MFAAYLLPGKSSSGRSGESAFQLERKQLARTILLLANFGREDTPETLVPQISQNTLAAMIGCARSRVNFFQNRFRKLGLLTAMIKFE